MTDWEWLAKLRRDGVQWDLWSTWDGKVCLRIKKGWRETWLPFCVEEADEATALASARRKWSQEWEGHSRTRLST